MPQFGLDNFLYEQTVDGKNANFVFTDPEDVTNSAEVAVSEKEIPEGALAGSRETADYAYSLVSKQLNEKRDARKVKAAQEQLQENQDKEAQVRASVADFNANSSDGTVEPTTTEKRDDGVEQNVYNTASLSEQADQNAGKKKK